MKIATTHVQKTPAKIRNVTYVLSAAKLQRTSRSHHNITEFYIKQVYFDGNIAKVSSLLLKLQTEMGSSFTEIHCIFD